MSLIFNKPPDLRWVEVSVPMLFWGTILAKGTHDEIRIQLMTYWRDHEKWDISTLKPESVLIAERPEMPVPKSMIEDAKADRAEGRKIFQG